MRRAKPSQISISLVHTTTMSSVDDTTHHITLPPVQAALVAFPPSCPVMTVVRGGGLGDFHKTDDDEKNNNNNNAATTTTIIVGKVESVFIDLSSTNREYNYRVRPLTKDSTGTTTFDTNSTDAPMPFLWSPSPTCSTHPTVPSRWTPPPFHPLSPNMMAPLMVKPAMKAIVLATIVEMPRSSPPSYQLHQQHLLPLTASYIISLMSSLARKMHGGICNAPSHPLRCSTVQLLIKIQPMTMPMYLWSRLSVLMDNEHHH